MRGTDPSRSHTERQQSQLSEQFGQVARHPKGQVTDSSHRALWDIRGIVLTISEAVFASEQVSKLGSREP